MKSRDFLELSQAVFSTESSVKFGTQFFVDTLAVNFSKFTWKSTPEIGGDALHYFETNEAKKEIDLLYYVNVDTNNPSSLSLWTETDFDPLKVTLKKGVIYGLGASHEKASLIPVLQAFEELVEESAFKDLNILFVAGYGREKNMIGAKRVLKEIVKGRNVKTLFVGHPTENKVSLSSVGRTKMEVFFPFSDEEKEHREDHETKENISSQSKVFNYKDGENLEDNAIFKALKACSLLPKSTVVLDFSGGVNTVTQAESVYLELDFVPSCKDSMVTKLSGFGELLEKLNKRLIKYFNGVDLNRALHMGRCQISEEGVSFFGFNFIPADVSHQKLADWYSEFQTFAKSHGGEVRVRDSKKPFINLKSETGLAKDFILEDGSLNVTEATFFSRHYKNIFIFGVGEEGVAKKPNEKVSLEEMRECKTVFSDLCKKMVVR